MPEGALSEARETVEIVNQRGLHARASAKFVNAVAKMSDSMRVTVYKDGAEPALAKLAGLVKDGFGED